MESWIQTYTGIRFDVIEPTASMIDIRDIAHALSNCCRFGGHTTGFYSVGQHSYLLAARVPDEDRLWGLLHDASEAYTGDITRPMKATLRKFTDSIDLIQDGIMRVIAVKFGLNWPMPDSVHEADERMLATEKRDLMPDAGHDWGLVAEPYNFTVRPERPDVVRRQFMETFQRLIVH